MTRLSIDTYGLHLRLKDWYGQRGEEFDDLALDADEADRVIEEWLSATGGSG